MDKVITTPPLSNTTTPSLTTTTTHTHSYNTRSQTNKIPITQFNSAFQNSFTEAYQDVGTAEDNKASRETGNIEEQPAATSKLQKVPFQKANHHSSTVVTPATGNGFPNSVLTPSVIHPGRKIFQDFNKSYPSLWFTTFELRLDCWGIKSDKIKTDVLLAHLADDALLAVLDIVFNNPTYLLLKTKLLQHYEPSMSARVAQLLNPESLGDRKPSEILTFLKTNVARNDISNDMLKELFISRMPEKVRMSLCTMPHASLDTLAAAADKMTETNRFTMFSGYDAPEYNQPAENRLLKTKLAALESKLDRIVRSNSSNQFETKPIFQKPQQSSQTSNIHSHQPQTLVENQVCYFHRKFGDRAFKCKQPCYWRINNPVQENYRHPRR